MLGHGPHRRLCLNEKSFTTEETEFHREVTQRISGNNAAAIFRTPGGELATVIILGASPEFRVPILSSPFADLSKSLFSGADRAAGTQGDK